MIIFYSPCLDKFDNEETFMYYTSNGMIFLKSKNHISRLNEVFKLDETNINEYAISRGFEKVLETFILDDFGNINVVWEEKFDTPEWREKTLSFANVTKMNLANTTRYRVIPDQTIKSCLAELTKLE